MTNIDPFAVEAGPVLSLDRASIFFDGQYSNPRIHHPECVAIGPDGAVWCGNAEGDILRIAPDGSGVTRMASTGGFTLGMAFDGAGHLFVCDQKSAAVWRLDLESLALERFTAPGIRIPNFPIVDVARGCLYVSDSLGANERGPGLWRYDLATGIGAIWWDEPMNFANGMVLDHTGSSLFVAETFGRRVSRISIGIDGTALHCSDYTGVLPGLPDGLALDDAGDLYVACYEPSRILRIATDGGIEVFAEDPTAGLICHPTNIAFDGARLYAANLGRWHITSLLTDTVGTSLFKRAISNPRAEPS